MAGHDRAVFKMLAIILDVSAKAEEKGHAHRAQPLLCRLPKATFIPIY